MSPVLFCPIFSQTLAEAGISREEYIALLQSAAGAVPADAQANFNQLIQLISQCP